MPSATSYVTVARDASAEIEVRRSRFLGTLARVESEEAARAVIEAARKEHWDARHHCSAFVLGPAGATARSNDDGEPAGTAGAPMLEVLRGAGVSDVVAVVTRWFGGVLLGTGGLARAYADATRAALAEAGTLERRLLREFTVEVSHADAGRLETDLRQRGHTVLDTTYAAAVTIRVAVDPAAPDAAGGVGTAHDLAAPGGFEATVQALTAGAATAVPTGERWVDH